MSSQSNCSPLLDCWASVGGAMVSAAMGLLLSSGIWGASLLAADSQVPVYEVRRVTSKLQIDGRLDEAAWFAARPIGDFHFPWFKSGAREQSLVKLVWDDDYLFIACVCQDAHITARHAQRGASLASDDCFEIMLAPSRDRPAFYYNVEWNPTGGYIDGHRPNGADAPRVEWDVRDMKLVGTHAGTLNNDTDKDTLWTAEVAIPWVNFREVLPHFPPQAGDEFRANFNRHGGESNPQFSQWSPADTPAPAFHVPSRFGRLILSPRTVPFGAGQ
jgi:hypothetical protein